MLSGSLVSGPAICFKHMLNDLSPPFPKRLDVTSCICYPTEEWRKLSSLKIKHSGEPQGACVCVFVMFRCVVAHMEDQSHFPDYLFLSLELGFFFSSFF